MLSYVHRRRVKQREELKFVPVHDDYAKACNVGDKFNQNLNVTGLINTAQKTVLVNMDNKTTLHFLFCSKMFGTYGSW